MRYLAALPRESFCHHYTQEKGLGYPTTSLQVAVATGRKAIGWQVVNAAGRPVGGGTLCGTNTNEQEKRFTKAVTCWLDNRMISENTKKEKV